MVINLGLKHKTVGQIRFNPKFHFPRSSGSALNIVVLVYSNEMQMSTNCHPITLHSIVGVLFW